MLLQSSKGFQQALKSRVYGSPSDPNNQGEMSLCTLGARRKVYELLLGLSVATDALPAQSPEP